MTHIDLDINMEQNNSFKIDRHAILLKVLKYTKKYKVWSWSGVLAKERANIHKLWVMNYDSYESWIILSWARQSNWGGTSRRVPLCCRPRSHGKIVSAPVPPAPASQFENFLQFLNFTQFCKKKLLTFSHVFF